MSPSIEEQSQQIQAAAATRLPPEVAEVFAGHLHDLRLTGASETAVAVDDVVEDFVLTDAAGKQVSLSGLVHDGPVVLVFYRGGWCPFCNVALRHYQSELVPQLARFDATLVAISPQMPDESLTVAERHGLVFPVLSDPGARLARRLGIAFTPASEVLAAQRKLGVDITLGNAEACADLPMPTVLVLDTDRVVRFADVRPDYTTRTEVPAIVAALADLQARPSRVGAA